MLKLSVTKLGNIDLSLNHLLPMLVKIFTNGWLLLGLACFASSMILWLKVISTMELSRAYPSVSLSYVIVFIVSVILFKEGVSMEKIGGVLCIILGVFLLQR